MMRRLLKLARDKRGAVAPTVALSLFALIGAGGIAFDYARLASLDTELQQAADQAALAAATQLDQQLGAVARATAAAQNLLANSTLFANDGNVANRAVTIPTVVFYATKADAEAASGQNCPTAGAVTADATARFVCVKTGTRIAKYAMTPVTNAMMSSNMSAMAVAGLGSAICKTPPVMICNPAETGGNTSFNADNYVGNGIKLVSVGNGSGTWVPGNFGYLDSNSTGNGASALRESLGWSSPPGDCLEGTGVDTKTGANVSVTDALNTRYDIYEANNSCPSGGSCPASINSVKDLVRPANGSGNKVCQLDNKDGWQEAASAYLPTSPTVPLTTTPSAMGHPRDMCHAVSVDGACSGGRIGTGLWDRDAYFRTNYLRTTAGAGGAAGTRWSAANWQSNTGLSPSVAITASNYASRYNVYKWEIAQRYALTLQVIDGVKVLDPNPAGATGSTKVAHGLPVCSQVQGGSPGYPVTPPGGTNPDRRRISAAVINCTANNVHGSSTNVPVEKWIELFLVEPSIDRASGRTNKGDVYVEVIGETIAGAGATAGQVVRRDLPYLVK